MSSDTENFWSSFKSKHFKEAAASFDSLSSTEKEMTLEALFQKAQHQNTPDVVSVLIRHLHEDKTINNFHQAWMPAQEHLNTLDKFGQIYHH